MTGNWDHYLSGASVHKMAFVLYSEPHTLKGLGPSFFFLPDSVGPDNEHSIYFFCCCNKLMLIWWLETDLLS